MYTGSGDVKQKRRARRPEGEEWSEAGIRNLRQQVKYALRFFVVETALHQKPKQLSLSPPSRTAASASSQAGQSNKTKETFNTRRAAQLANAQKRAGGAVESCQRNNEKEYRKTQQKEKEVSWSSREVNYSSRPANLLLELTGNN